MPRGSYGSGSGTIPLLGDRIQLLLNRNVDQLHSEADVQRQPSRPTAAKEAVVGREVDDLDFLGQVNQALHDQVADVHGTPGRIQGIHDQPAVVLAAALLALKQHLDEVPRLGPESLHLLGMQEFLLVGVLERCKTKMLARLAASCWFLAADCLTD
jgi:hypothetical protein